MLFINRNIILATYAFLVCVNVNATQVTVKASLDSAKIKIGEQARITLSVTKEKKTNVVFPVIPDTLNDGVEIVGITNRDTTELDNGFESISQQIVVTAFDSTLALIKPFVFYCNGDSLKTDELSLKVDPIKVDTVKKDLKEIKPIYNAPIDWAFIIKTILIILFILALLSCGVLLYRKYHKKKIENKEEKLIPVDPYSFAVEKLNMIKSEKVWQKGLVKKYYTDVTDVLREYIEYRFSIDACEMTSDQIVYSLSCNESFCMCNNNDIIKSDFNEVLQLADLVKFAKWTPSFADNDRVILLAQDFLDKTKENHKIEEDSKDIMSDCAPNEDGPLK